MIGLHMELKYLANTKEVTVSKNSTDPAAKVHYITFVKSRR
jgi:hypothetical protein